MREKINTAEKKHKMYEDLVKSYSEIKRREN
jgi:hypothetical protein